MRHLDLFSGIGGFALAASWLGWETVGFCEVDEYCCQTLAKNFPYVPRHGNIKTLKGDEFGQIDIITGGYPCQPFSVSGKRQGDQDDRHLWPEMFRVIKQARPPRVVAENVTGHITMGLDSVLLDLESEGYACRPVVVPAVAVDAKHRRDRVWIVAYADHERGEPEQVSELRSEDTPKPRDDGKKEPLANPDRPRLKKRRGGCAVQAKVVTPQRNRSTVANSDSHEQHGRGGALQMGRSGGKKKAKNNGLAERAKWPPEPAVGRVANGVPRRVDRLKALGNAIVPQVAYKILEAIDHENA